MRLLQWTRLSRQTLTDVAVAVAFALGTTAPLLVTRFGYLLGWGAVWSLLMCASLAVRRAAPMIALLVASVAGLGMVVTLTVPVPALIAVPVVAYSVARYQDWSALVFVLVPAVFGAIAGPYTWTRDVPEAYRYLAVGGLVLLSFSIVAVAYLAGRLVRERYFNAQLDTEIATQRFAAARRHTEQANQLATGRARAEVAQELHDVLAHSLSIIVVQAEGARALTTKRPEAAQEALTVIAETGRRSIGEVRRIVALMRGDDAVPDFGPTPSLSDIPELVVSAGARVRLSIEGETPIVPDSLGLVAFRVVQESLTNFLKHAGKTAEGDVLVRYLPDSIEVLVRDDGIGAMSHTDGHGSGVPGMRERVLSMGGEFAAGPRPGGGYQVRARLPIASQLGKGWL